MNRWVYQDNKKPEPSGNYAHMRLSQLKICILWVKCKAHHWAHFHTWIIKDITYHAHQCCPTTICSIVGWVCAILVHCIHAYVFCYIYIFGGGVSTQCSMHSNSLFLTKASCSMSSIMPYTYTRLLSSLRLIFIVFFLVTNFLDIKGFKGLAHTWHHIWKKSVLPCPSHVTITQHVKVTKLPIKNIMT